MHPVEEIRGEKSGKLDGKKIILGITSSIAAIESVKLARELIRYGALLIPVMTQAATKIVHPHSLEFATGKKPITELTGEVEHVSHGKDDLLLIAPCTANTISKIALGISDNPLTTFATAAIEKMKVMIAPAMHLSMYENEVIKKNIQKCKEMGIIFIDPLIENKAAKMAKNEEIVESVIRAIGKNDLDGRKILIIGGATKEKIDDVRVITNLSSGKTSISLVITAFERGAIVELWYGNDFPPPSFIEVSRFKSIDDLISLTKKAKIDKKNFDLIINCAAIADYKPKKYEGKIPSGKKKLLLELFPTPIIIDRLRELGSILMGFKLEAKKENIVKKAREKLLSSKMDYIVANTLDNIGKDENEIWMIDKNGYLKKEGKKDELANEIFDFVYG